MRPAPRRRSVDRTWRRSGSCEKRLSLSDVFVAATGQADEDRAVRLALRELQRVSESVCRFERAEDALPLGERLESRERLGIRNADIFAAAALLEIGRASCRERV